MDKYYHFTSLNNIEDIIKYGLVPQTGFRCYSIDDKSRGVFLSKGMDKAIQMYAIMLGYYEDVVGHCGDIVLQDCLRKLQELSQETQDFRTKISIEDCLSTIERIKAIRSCRSFRTYRGNDCCYLSIEGIKPDNEFLPSNCRYDNVIPPSNINVVNIRHKATNHYTYDLDAVLSYFMYLYPINEVTKGVSLDNCNDIKKLYKYRDESPYVNFNPNDYESVDIPLLNYSNVYQKSKSVY